MGFSQREKVWVHGLFLSKSSGMYQMYIAYIFPCPRHPAILSEENLGVQSSSKRIEFRLHYHSQKVIGSLWDVFFLNYVAGFLRRGCSRGGGNWGTLRIPREDWGTLGNIRED